MRSAIYPGEEAVRMQVFTYPSPVLSQISDRVGEVTGDIVLLGKLMIETLNSQEGAGLAAPQVGHLKRMIVIDPACQSKSSGGEIFAMIDPKITSSTGKVIDEEGCLSMPFIYANLPRAKYIKVEYTDIDGEKQEIEAEGFLARCIAHEIDHLDGILFWDRVSWAKREFLKIKHWRNQG